VTVAMIAVVIIGREITVSALREWMAGIGERAQVAVSWTGKVKTGFQMFGIAFMVYEVPLFGLDIYTLGYWLLVIASVMTLWSMFIYLKAAWPTLNAAD
jgi:phosphatidylglycerophosphate synthase